MTIQLSDCTIRDGGYVTNKQFPTPFIKGVIAGLSNAGVDYVEIGFLQKTSNGEPIVYRHTQDILPYLPTQSEKTIFVGFCDNSKYDIASLDVCDNKTIKGLRISFAKHERWEALDFCRAAKDKGYRIFIQPMDTPGYDTSERAEMIKAVNTILPESLAIVDSFGMMHLQLFRTIFRQVDELLNPSIKIGLHSHNNLQLSCALVEDLLTMASQTDRNVIVDGSLLGMGRGAGNANTEIIAHLLNSCYDKKYNLPILLQTIEKYVLPLSRHVSWGYNIPMFLCGAFASHVDNAYHIQQMGKFSINEMYDMLTHLNPEKRKRYGEGYNKNDFSVLDKIIDNYNHKNNV